MITTSKPSSFVSQPSCGWRERRVERATPVRKPHTFTTDVLTCSETPPASLPPSNISGARSHQPSDGISKVVFGGQVTDEEAQNLLKTLLPVTVSAIMHPFHTFGMDAK
ncbi:hypothetical protein Ancab_003395 [Ancistrocladus abbreviatus]